MIRYLTCVILIAFIGNACGCISVHKCISNSIVEYEGEQYTCVDGQVCNWNNVEPCNACISVPFKCSDADESIVIYEGEVLRCDANYICNKNYLPPLKPCIPGQCDGTKPFTCSKEDLTVVIITPLFKLKCLGGQICNKNYIAPCTKCIQETESGNQPSPTTTFSPPTLPHTAKPTIPSTQSTTTGTTSTTTSKN